MQRIGYVKICIEIQKNFSLPNYLSVMRFGDSGALEKVEIPVTYPWKPNNSIKKWLPTGKKKFATDWHDKLVGTDSTITDLASGFNSIEDNVQGVTSPTAPFPSTIEVLPMDFIAPNPSGFDPKAGNIRIEKSPNSTADLPTNKVVPTAIVTLAADIVPSPCHTFCPTLDALDDQHTGAVSG
ncbi:hypothetical protein K2173_017422 [Erythroxylum novogranatense]|uniref:Uncharacterized protein n=1 Tax=Erythroxylum novogranatense TaxID=1862640 RepID=A0AAV8TME6_9ROSI|nr:hypothetical protein K2173_017422 [Erythroxylum novogranatense]